MKRKKEKIGKKVAKLFSQRFSKKEKFQKPMNAVRAGVPLLAKLQGTLLKKTTSRISLASL